MDVLALNYSIKLEIKNKVFFWNSVYGCKHNHIQHEDFSTALA